MNRADEQSQTNPLREGLSMRAVPQPCSVVIFGATGDLTHRKLVPALYNLAADGELPPAVAVIGFPRCATRPAGESVSPPGLGCVGPPRREKSDDEFRREMEEATRKFSRQNVRD